MYFDLKRGNSEAVKFFSLKKRNKQSLFRRGRERCYGYPYFSFKAELRTFYDRRRVGNREGIIHRVIVEEPDY